MDRVDEGDRLGPFALRHHPLDEPGNADSARLVLHGHVHPAVAVSDRLGHRGRFPAFVQAASRAGWPTQLCLPAFGSFTGCKALPAATIERAWLIVENAVLSCPAAALRAR